MLRDTLRDVIGPALSRLPARGRIRRPEQARQRLPGLTTNQPVMEVRLMADANSTRAPDARSSNGTPLFNNPCPDCGIVRLSDIRRLGKPCHPCAQKRRQTHGLSNRPIYRLLKSMQARCDYPSSSSYKYYGARGITVCEEWRSNPAAFAAWAEANGYAQGMEIDRKDVNGPYTPWNCQFIAHAQNSRKRRNARCDESTALGIKSALADGLHYKQAASRFGVPPMVAWHISKGNTWRDV